MKNAMMDRGSSVVASLAIWATLVSTPGLSFGADRLNFKPGFNLFAPKQDVQVGKENAAQVDKQLPILRDAEVERYVNDLGRRLSTYAPNNRSEYVWQFKVVNSGDINAFALPGGFIYVNRGAIEAAQDEAQIAGVIAHEEGHVVMRHGTHQASQIMFAQAPLSILGGLLGQGGSLMGQLAQMGIGLGVNSVFLHNSRGMESQADQIGTYILYQAGYDPHAMAQFFQIIEKKYPERTSQFFSDHPNPGNRIQAVDAEIPQLGPARQGKTDSAEFEAVKKRLLGLPAPPKARPRAQQGDPGDGGSRADLTPSDKFKTLNHSAFSISYPENWQIFGDKSSAVTIAPRAGVSQNAVAYGVMINSFEPEQGRGGSLDEATHELINTLHQSNPDLRVIGHGENIHVSGVPGKSVDLVGPSPIRRECGGTQRERDWLVTFQRNDGTLLYLVFISPEDDFHRLRPAFEGMLRSVRLS
jgi:hypothetical protein